MGLIRVGITQFSGIMHKNKKIMQRAEVGQNVLEVRYFTLVSSSDFLLN